MECCRHRDQELAIQPTAGGHYALAATEIVGVAIQMPQPAVAVTTGEEEKQPLDLNVLAAPQQGIEPPWRQRRQPCIN